MTRGMVRGMNTPHRLFIDVDGTLRKPEGAGELNTELISSVFGYIGNSDSTVALVVWSGGGESYAARWARAAFPQWRWDASSKHRGLVRPGDVVVDDMSEEDLTGLLPRGEGTGRALVLTPERFIEMVRDSGYA